MNLFEILKLATAYACSTCIILVPGGSYVRNADHPPAVCFSNGHVPTSEDFQAIAMLDVRAARTAMEAMNKGEPNGIELVHRRDGGGDKLVYIVGKDIVDCRKPATIPVP